ncbi:hypothetical protein, partial [Secundilactobacillus collinoides]
MSMLSCFSLDLQQMVADSHKKHPGLKFNYGISVWGVFYYGSKTVFWISFVLSTARMGASAEATLGIKVSFGLLWVNRLSSACDVGLGLIAETSSARLRATAEATL